MSARAFARRVASWAVVASVGLTASLALSGARAQDVGPDAPTLVRGAELYSTHCAQCHGAAGQGRPDVAPPIDDAHLALVDLVLRTRRMPPGDPGGDTKGQVVFDDADRRALVVWMDDTFGLPGAIPQVDPEQGDPARGQAVYATNCAACHGSTGAGGVAGAGAFTPNLLGLEPVTIAEAIRMGPFEMPRFGERQIDDQGVDDVVAFLDLVHQEPTTPIGVAELNPVFASAFVFVLTVAVLLSSMWISGRVQLFPSEQERLRARRREGEGP